MRPQVGRTTRVKKLQPRALQPVLRQDQIESEEYDSLQGQYKVETGVEKSEESVCFAHSHLPIFSVIIYMSRVMDHTAL